MYRYTSAPQAEKESFKSFYIDLHFYCNNPLKSWERLLFVAIKQLKPLMNVIKNAFCVRKHGRRFSGADAGPVHSTPTFTVEQSE